MMTLRTNSRRSVGDGTPGCQRHRWRPRLCDASTITFQLLQLCGRLGGAATLTLWPCHQPALCNEGDRHSINCKTLLRLVASQAWTTVRSQLQDQLTRSKVAMDTSLRVLSGKDDASPQSCVSAWLLLSQVRRRGACCRRHHHRLCVFDAHAPLLSMCPVDHQAITGSAAAANAAAPSMPLFRPSHGKSALEIAKSVADITTGQVDASTSAVCPSLVRTRGVVMRQEFELPLRLADGKGFPVPHALAAQQLDVTVVISSGKRVMPFTLRPDDADAGKCYLRTIVNPGASVQPTVAEEAVVSVKLKSGEHIVGSPAVIRAVSASGDGGKWCEVTCYRSHMHMLQACCLQNDRRVSACYWLPSYCMFAEFRYQPV